MSPTWKRQQFQLFRGLEYAQQSDIFVLCTQNVDAKDERAAIWEKKRKDVRNFSFANSPQTWTTQGSRRVRRRSAPPPRFVGMSIFSSTYD